jgi:hypothetical protein
VTPGGVTVRTAVAVEPYVAEMLAFIGAGTETVAIENVAVVPPAAIVTDAGTVTAALSLRSATIAPPAGAGSFKVTVPIEPRPPVTVNGFKSRDETAGGLIVREAACVTPKVALIAAVVVEATAVVFTANVAVVAPAATITLGGTVADALLLESVTAIPPTGAAEFRVTVAVVLLPPVTVVESRVTDKTEGAAIVNVVLRVTS